MLATVAAIGLGVFALAPAASAHHSEIQASSDCTQQVAWTATSWNPGADNGVNHSVKVWYVADDGPTAGTKVNAATGKFDYDNNFSFSGMFPWPNAGATSLTVFVQEQDNWGPNENLAGPSSARSTKVSAPSDCPGTPGATSQVACTSGDGTVTITLTATGGSSPIDFTVTNPVNQQKTNKTVAPGQSTTVTVSGLPDGQNVIPVTGGGKKLDQTVTVNCDRPGTPSVSAKVECSNGNGDVTVTLANTGGDKSVTFVVTNPLTQAPTQKVVAPGQSTTVTISGLADGQTVIPVTADGTNVDQTVTVTCDRPGTPSVTSNVQCSNGNGDVTVTLANTGGDKSVTFVVTNPLTQAPTQRVVAPGQSTTVTISGLADGQTTIPVTADGKPINQNVTVNCDRPGVPSVTSSVACTSGDGKVTVTLANTGGDLPISFTVTDPRTNAKTTKTVNVGGSETVVLNGFADGNHTIPVEAGTTHLDQTLTVHCDVPGVASVTVAHECANFDGTATVTLGNTGGTEPIHFVVTNPVTNTPSSYDVPVGGSQTVTIPGLPDGSVTIPVTADGKAMNQTFTVDCDRPGTPAASGKAECTTTGGEVTVTLANASAAGTAEPIEFVVTNPIDGKKTTVTVAAGTSTTVVFADVPEGSYDIAVTADGTPLPAVSVTVDCQKPGVSSVSLSCSEEGAVVTLTNDGKTPVTLTVNADGQTVSTVTVAANGSTDVVVPLVQDQATTITVLDGSTTVDEQTVTLNCVQPTTTSTTTPSSSTSSTSSTTPSSSTSTTPTDPSTTPSPTATVKGISVERPDTTTGSLPVTGTQAVQLALVALLLTAAGTCIVLATGKR